MARRFEGGAAQPPEKTMTTDDSFRDLRPRLETGDPQAAAEVFHRFARRLIGLARGRLDARIQRKIDAEDVVQSVFKSFFRRQADEGFELESWDSLWSLLVVMTVRKCGHKVQLLRAARRDVRREAAADGASATSTWQFEAASDEPRPDEAVALAELLEQVMTELTERERDMLSLRLQGYSTEEIAQSVGRTERTVQRLLQSIRARWERACLETT
jgi:RNA polymerase sigma-70 factor (ECF subfamily)